MESLNLINPINISLAQIKESLFESRSISMGDEISSYGTFKTEFDKFYIQHKRAGKTVFKIDFFNSKLEELEKLEDGIINIENRSKSIEYTSVLKSIIKIRAIITSLISNENPPIRKSKKTTLTYKRIKNPSLVNDLYISLKSYSLIDKATKYDDFLLIFDNKNITEIINPVIWNSTASELLYFIKQIQGVLIEPKDREDYLLLKSCFTKPNGVQFSENFKNLKSEVEIKVSTNKQSIINKIIQKISK